MSIKAPHLKISQRAFIFLLVITLTPSIIIGAVSYQLTKTALRDQAITNAMLVSSTQKEKFENLRGYIELFSEDLEENYLSDNRYIFALNQEVTIEKDLQNILINYPEISKSISVIILTKEGNKYYFNQNDWICTLKDDPLQTINSNTYIKYELSGWIDPDINIGVDCSESGFVHYVKNAKTNYAESNDLDALSSIIVNVNVNRLIKEQIIENVNHGGNLVLVSNDNKILSHPNHDLIGEQYELNYQVRDRLNDGLLVENNSGDIYLMTSMEIKDSNLKLIYLSPYGSIYVKSSVIGSMIFFMLIISTSVLYYITVQLSKNFVHPIEQITDRLKLYFDGSTEWQKPLEVRSNDEFGALTKWFNIFLDAMKQKQVVEKALKTSEERYALALEATKDGIWDWDVETNQAFFSPRWKAIVGCEGEDFEDSIEFWFDKVHPEDIHQLRSDFINHIEGRTAYLENEHRITTKDQETNIWIQVRGLAIRDEKNYVYRMAGSISDITERKAFEDQLIHDAMHDSLTHLPNRIYFLDHLKRTIERSKRHQEYTAAVIYIDLDRFKIINDSLGHHAGDGYLVETAARLSQFLRAGDVIARMGGDEFALLLDDIKDIYDATRVVKRLQSLLSQPITIQGQEIVSTASMGIALSSKGYDKAEELLRDADTAMNRAKSNGRSRYEIFGSEMHAQTVSLLRTEVGLRRAIDREEFVLYYQPIVSLPDMGINSVEALIRWAKPGNGIVYPDKFISLAEETGLIIQIGEWVLKNACLDCKKWHDQGYTDISVSVNISANQLKDDKFLNRIQNALNQSGLDSKYLTLEITESIAMDDIETSIELLTELNNMGVTISIDDFGTSYSSLEYLKRFPVHNLKIDKSFVNELAENQDNVAITNAIIAMAHIMGLKSIAEGVEVEDQLRILTELGCDNIQGYYISRPVTEIEVQKFFKIKNPE